jgi:hypothetical protein
MALACRAKEGAERGLRVSAPPVSSRCHDPLAEAGPRVCGSLWLRGLYGEVEDASGLDVWVVKKKRPCLRRNSCLIGGHIRAGMVGGRDPAFRTGDRSGPVEACDRDAWLPILLDGDRLVSEGAGFDVFAIVDVSC